MKDEKEFFIFRFSGNSMMPEYTNGIMLKVKKCYIEDISKNDIIVFADGEKKIAHRCIRKKKDFIITKGDNRIFPDKPIKAGQIIGKVIGFSERERKMPLIKYYLLPYPFSSILLFMLRFIKYPSFRHSVLLMLMNIWERIKQ